MAYRKIWNLKNQYLYLVKRFRLMCQSLLGVGHCLAPRYLWKKAKICCTHLPVPQNEPQLTCSDHWATHKCTKYRYMHWKEGEGRFNVMPHSKITDYLKLPFLWVWKWLEPSVTKNSLFQVWLLLPELNKKWHSSFSSGIWLWQSDPSSWLFRTLVISAAPDASIFTRLRLKTAIWMVIPL